MHQKNIKMFSSLIVLLKAFQDIDSSHIFKDFFNLELFGNTNVNGFAFSILMTSIYEMFAMHLHTSDLSSLISNRCILSTTHKNQAICVHCQTQKIQKLIVQI